MKWMYLMGFLLAFAGPACSPTAARKYLLPFVPPEKVTDEAEYFDPRADILFVVDNSGSMGNHQRNLATNINLFTSTFLQKSILQYNIAVITTDTASGVNCCGRFVGNVRVINKQTPDADMNLQRNLMVGTYGDIIEKVFDPVVMALSEPNLSTHNSGFLREDASLIVIPITDADDQSRHYPDPAVFYDFLVKLKKGNKRKVLAFGAIASSGIADCARDGGPPVGIERFMGMIRPNGTNIVNLCDPDFGQKLAQFAMDIVKDVGSTIYLSRAPVLSSIRVVYGSLDLPNDYDKGWAYDPDKNALRLGSEIDWSSQPAGSQVKVYYSAARFPEE